MNSHHNPHLQHVCAPVVVPLRPNSSSKAESDETCGGEDSELGETLLAVASMETETGKT